MKRFHSPGCRLYYLCIIYGFTFASGCVCVYVRCWLRANRHHPLALPDTFPKQRQPWLSSFSHLWAPLSDSYLPLHSDQSFFHVACPPPLTSGKHQSISVSCICELNFPFVWVFLRFHIEEIYTASVFHCLTFVTQPDTPKVYLCRKWQDVPLLYGWIIFHWERVGERKWVCFIFSLSTH